ncbi:hypothetical protein [Gracilibacillus saliphilus]|nr:hypothetical protein [Gracilibacillus saliphilus]
MISNNQQQLDPEWLRLIYLAKETGSTKKEVKRLLGYLPESKIIKYS